MTILIWRYKMSEIIAKVGKEFKNVLNQEDNIIDDIEIEISETFSPSYKLDENEWYKFEKVDVYGCMEMDRRSNCKSCKSGKSCSR